MPDGTSRFSTTDGTPIAHFMGCSTFSEYTVVPEIACAKIRDDAPLGVASLLGCGVATGLGAVWNNCDVEGGSSVAVFGLGAVGLSVIQGARMRGAKRIFAIDTNSGKFDVATQFGATDCINPTDHDRPIQEVLVEMSCTGFGIDYTFDATGNTEVMRAALEAAHRGWGESCVIGVAKSGAEISTRPFQLVTGRKWLGTAFGGVKSRSEVPPMIDDYMNGDLELVGGAKHKQFVVFFGGVKHLYTNYMWCVIHIFTQDQFITHRFEGIEGTMDAIEALHSGDCLRAVVTY